MERRPEKKIVDTFVMWDETLHNGRRGAFIANWKGLLDKSGIRQFTSLGEKGGLAWVGHDCLDVEGRRGCRGFNVRGNP